MKITSIFTSSDAITIISSLISGIIGVSITLFIQWRKEKKEENNNKKFIKMLKETIWRDKILVLYESLLEIQRNIFMEEKHQILSEICEYYIDCIHSEEQPPSISDLEKRASILIQWMSEEDYDHILYEYKTGGYLGLYDVIDKLYIKSDIAQIDEAKSTYKKLVFRSIDEIKELKKDIRAQPHKLSINTLIILQKIIDILEKIFYYMQIKTIYINL